MSSRIDEEDRFCRQVHLLNEFSVNSVESLDALNSLLTLYLSIANNIVRKMVSWDAANSMDLEQVATDSLFDFYTRYLRTLPCKIKSHSDAKSILILIVRNHLLNHVRDIHRKKRTPKRGMNRLYDYELDQVASKGRSIGEAYDAVELHEILRCHLGNSLLNETFEKLCIGHDLVQIAEQIGCCRRTVERRVNEIRNRLKIWDTVN